MDSHDRLTEGIRPNNRVWPFPDPLAPEASVPTAPDMDADIEPETIAEFLSVAEHYLNS